MWQLMATESKRNAATDVNNVVAVVNVDVDVIMVADDDDDDADEQVLLVSLVIENVVCMCAYLCVCW